MTQPRLPILVVEDDPNLREAICDTLELSGRPFLAVGGGAEALAALGKNPVAIVLSDVRMMPMDGITLLKLIRTTYPHLPVVLMTAYAEVGRAVEAMRAGACDFLLKPFEPKALLAQIEKYELPDTGQTVGVVASDSAMANLLTVAARVAQTDASVLLTGESGVGKEVVARFIHQRSARRDGPFVAINCAAIPESLLEATLFGYEKGAFTGATQAQAGKFEQANGGTLLLDEITEMPLALQAKLLRVLQEREVERVGGKKPVALDIRIISTSNRDMAEAVAKGIFREDLFYRLNVFPVAIPALRERPADIVPLASHFIASHGARIGRRGVTLSRAAEAALSAYHWPGNVREMENVVQRALILAGDVIEPEHLNIVPARLPAAEPGIRQEAPVTAISAQPTLQESGQKIDNMKVLERDHILRTLNEVGGSRKLAVERLGISERTLRYKLAQYREEGYIKE
ncbi:MAG: sigma-54-dependent transcriptional regulator [Betaproteobacteria bacterium]